ncbi:hypothetical protein D3C81_1131230 [compost metagenome]
MRGNLGHPIGEDLDARQAEVLGAGELLADLVEHFQVGGCALGVGDHQRGNPQLQFTLVGQGLVGRQHTNGFGGGLEIEQGIAWGGVGRRVHQGGDTQAVVEVAGGLAGIDQLREAGRWQL